ncbi:hypothetical protein [Stigmatella erecta]|uniref:Lipoprotein n=1 Tax=Stigmatella erecta TaxID=83460 RepID=A0A1I0KW75_9BACT|nr:hypothetical protein [Stigmatella erecta]SEU30546.1 hypothetical protein SAMN05443639_115111 [Stigmatella erecta]
MLKPLGFLLLTAGLLLSGCGVPEEALEGPASPPEAPAEAEAGGEYTASAAAIWESVQTPGYTPYTQVCSGVIGAACAVPGETCTWFSANYSWGPYSVSKVCRPVNGTYRAIETVSQNCVSGGHTACPDGETAGKPCGHKGSYCIRQCYTYPGPAITVRAYCQ